MVLQVASRIVALNIRAGGGRRVSDLCAYLGRQNPDLMVLTEWRDSLPGMAFRAWAEARGYHHRVLNDGGTANGVLIAARAPFTVSSVTPRGDATGVLALAQFASFTLLGCYFPSMLAKAPFFARAAEVADHHAKRPFLLLGDLNTGNQLTDRVPTGVRYHCADAFDALAQVHGLVDLWRDTHGPAARDWSWLSHRRNGFRLDHAFANQAFRRAAGTRCHYDHLPRQSGLSDHSALLLATEPTPRHRPATLRR